MEEKKNLINNSKLTDSQKLKLMNEMDNLSSEELIQIINELEVNKQESNNSNIKNKNKMSKKELIIIVISIIVFIFLVFAMESDKNTNNSNINKDYTTTSKDTSSTSEDKEVVEKPVELTEAQKMQVQLVRLIDSSDLVFDTGSYIAGDIPSGEYAFIRFGDGQYYCENDMAGNIVDNENFDSFGYVKVHGVGNLTTRGVLVNVTAFEQLGVSSAKELFEKLNGIENYNQGGYYKVGVDIPAGTYIIESIGGRGYYSKNTGPVANSSIIDNDNFDGKVSVNLTNGQYIEVSRAIISAKQ